ncbi:MAG: hypothetical protein QOD14_2022 [Solirubrobacterales bacterium]|nr:hypothetical protein [Solirubrobacterales bacterium]
MRRRPLLGCVATAGALALLCAPASAVIVQTPAGTVSYAPRNGGGPSGRAQTAGGNLTWHGGPVMHANKSYAIAWDPTSAFPAGYMTLMSQYVGDVAADSGQSTNVYSVGSQYTDSTGRASYSSTSGGSLVDSDAYPASSGCPVVSGFTKCLTNAQLRAELNSFVTTNSLPRGLATIYYLFLPAQVDVCFDPAGTTCFSNVFCAYHDHTAASGTETIYAAMPYGADFPSGCGTGQHPNSAVSSVGDDELSVLSHEANEAITDPTLTAWYDSANNENGDKCRNTADDYGTSLGGSSGFLYNQLINADHYYLQREWGNGAGGCEQRNALPTAAFSAPAPTAGVSASFSGAGSADSDGGISGYAWNFGDGGTGSGVTPSHAYATSGTRTVNLTVTDVNGFTASTGHMVSVAARTTSTSAACNPSSVPVGTGTACTATVTDTSPPSASSPQGTVAFSSSGTGGSFSAPTCTLTPAGSGVSSCQVTYAPGRLGSGSELIGGGYSGDAAHVGSSGSTSIAVVNSTGVDGSASTTPITSTTSPLVPRKKCRRHRRHHRHCKRHRSLVSAESGRSRTRTWDLFLIREAL